MVFLFGVDEVGDGLTLAKFQKFCESTET